MTDTSRCRGARAGRRKRKTTRKATEMSDAAEELLAGVAVLIGVALHDYPYGAPAVTEVTEGIREALDLDGDEQPGEIVAAVRRVLGLPAGEAGEPG